MDQGWAATAFIKLVRAQLYPILVLPLGLILEIES